ncbi:MAG: response regulator [Pseudomonadota bacterium]
MNVLLAEDNPVNQEVAVGLLEALDCAVTVVENGKEAVDAVTGKAFDLVLMDCQMPVMDGLDATRTIRKSSTDNESPPIVALTADSSETIRTDCLSAGMNDLLGKPFTFQELHTLLQRWQPATPAAPMKPPEDPPRTSTSTLDLGPIDALRSLDPGDERRLVQRAITKFVDYSEGLVDGLARAVAEDDVAEVSRIAHSMKSSSANLGAVDLARQCAEIEKLTGDGSLPEDMDQRLTALRATHQAAKADFLQLCEGE